MDSCGDSALLEYAEAALGPALGMCSNFIPHLGEATRAHGHAAESCGAATAKKIKSFLCM